MTMTAELATPNALSVPALGLALSRSVLDRVLVKDEAFYDFACGTGVIRPADDSSKHPWVPAHQLHRLAKQIGSWTWETCPLPVWAESSMAEAKWASGHVFRQTSVAWLFGGRRAVIQAPYTLTLADRIDDLASDYYWSRDLNGWVIETPEDDADELRDIFETYDILPSAKLSTALEGRGEWRRALDALVEAAKGEGFRVPTDIKSGRTFKPHQQEAVLAMAYRGGCNLLADQVGLGKGGEFIGGGLVLEDWLQRMHGQTTYPTVVSVTKSMKDEIAAEILKWKHNAQIQILNGRKQGDIDPNAEYIILNHDLLSDRIDDILDAKPRAFIADESHVFKSETTARTKAAIKLADDIRRRVEDPYIVMASGTPFLNKPSELWAILRILGKDVEFGEYALDKVGRDLQVRVKTRYGPMMKKIWGQRAFEMRWCGGKHRKWRNSEGELQLGDWEANGATNTAELNRLLVRQVMVRRRKSDVIDPLPPLTEQLVPIACEDEDLVEQYEKVQHEFIDFVVERARAEAEETGVSERVAVRHALAKLDAGEQVMQMTALRQHVAMMKLQGTVDWIHRFMAGDPGITGGDPSRRKLIVYAYHRDPQITLAQHPDLQQYGVVTILSGKDQKDEEIQQNKKAFQEDPNIRLIVCSMAAREGHTLTAAKDVYLHEIPFVPSWVVQMAGRCWARFSELYEPHEAYLHYAVSLGTIDSDLVRMVRTKKQRFDAVIDGEGQGDENESDLNDKSVDILARIIEGTAGKFSLAR